MLAVRCGVLAAGSSILDSYHDRRVCLRVAGRRSGCKGFQCCEESLRFGGRLFVFHRGVRVGYDARAYMEMEDSDAARVILEEVAEEGNEDQRAEAKEMLERLP